MREVVPVTRLAQARALLHPIRVELVHLLAEPRTCRQLAEALGLTQQRLNHHLKELRGVKLIRIVKTNRRGNLLEAVYQRTAKVYWLAPELLRSTAKTRVQSLSLHNLQRMAEGLQADVADLLSRTEEGEEIPSLGFDLEITLRDDVERDAFARDLLRAVHRLAESYQGRPGGRRYKVLLSAYPAVSQEGSS
jgi:DNA-binding transcriptional ArsR family regulator